MVWKTNFSEGFDDAAGGGGVESTVAAASPATPAPARRQQQRLRPVNLAAAHGGPDDIPQARSAPRPQPKPVHVGYDSPGPGAGSAPAVAPPTTSPRWVQAVGTVRDMAAAGPEVVHLGSKLFTEPPVEYHRVGQPHTVSTEPREGSTADVTAVLEQIVHQVDALTKTMSLLEERLSMVDAAGPAEAHGGSGGRGGMGIRPTPPVAGMQSEAGANV